MKQEKFIAYIEPSIIIKEGLVTILKRNNIDTEPIFFDSIKELIASKEKANIKLVLINSDLSIEDIHLIQKLKAELMNTKWIGLVSTFQHREFSDVVSNVVYINDDEHTLTNIVNETLEHESKSPAFEHVLSDREVDVLKLLVKGKMNKEIADELFISIHTVVTHRKNITHKLGIKSTAAMAIYAVANNIININESIKYIK